MKQQNIGFIYKEEIKKRDGSSWTQDILDIRSITFRRKFLLRIESSGTWSVLYNVAFKGEALPYIKVGEIKESKGYIYDPLTMNNPLKFFLKNVGVDEGVVPNQKALIFVKLDG